MFVQSQYCGKLKSSGEIHPKSLNRIANIGYTSGRIILVFIMTKMDNPEKLAILATQDQDKQNKNTTQYL
jgi:hypothetical protein